jgi:hypothetical protein
MQIENQKNACILFDEITIFKILVYNIQIIYDVQNQSLFRAKFVIFSCFNGEDFNSIPICAKSASELELGS